MASLSMVPVFRIRLRNPTSSPLDLWIEPLGDRVAIPGNTTAEVHCTEQLGYPSEFEMTKDGITLHGSAHSVFAVTPQGELKSLWTFPEESSGFDTESREPAT